MELFFKQNLIRSVKNVYNIGSRERWILFDVNACKNIQDSFFQWKIEKDFLLCKD